MKINSITWCNEDIQCYLSKAEVCYALVVNFPINNTVFQTLSYKGNLGR